MYLKPVFVIIQRREVEPSCSVSLLCQHLENRHALTSQVEAQTLTRLTRILRVESPLLHGRPRIRGTEGIIVAYNYHLWRLPWSESSQAEFPVVKRNQSMESVIQIYGQS